MNNEKSGDIILDKEENEFMEKSFNEWLSDNGIEPEKKEIDSIEEV